MEDKMKMCKYCNFNNRTYADEVLYDNEIIEVMLNDGPALEVNEYNQQGDYCTRDNLGFDFKINYCPMCARELTE